jgi:hypothetical protein
MARLCLLLGALAALVGCDMFSADTSWHSGNYRLIAVDTRGQMYLAVDEPQGSPTSVVGPTVFSIGADDGHIVVKQHPSKDAFGAFDRSVTNYFVVDLAGGQRTVHGPLSLEEFNKLSASESLPAFTKTFDDLK